MRLSPAQRTREFERLSSHLEALAPRTHEHSRRVADHAAAIAAEIGLPGGLVAKIHVAALLHDVGKVETPREIIDKPAALTAEEYGVIKEHAPAGARMVAGLGDDALTAIVAHHHERFDGGGYPAGLGGEEIPLGARIIAVADTFDALTSPRPYRAAMSEARALALVDALAGSQLDPAVVDAFQRCQARRRASVPGVRPRPRSLLPRLQRRRTRLGPSTAAPTRLAAG